MKNRIDKIGFIINGKSKKIGVVLDWVTYKKIEEFYEDFILGQKMDVANKTKTYTIKEATMKLKSLDILI